jgi:hypothetical protein
MQRSFFWYFLGSTFVFTLVPSFTNAQTTQAAQTAQTPCPACTATSPGFDKDSGFCLPSSAAGLTFVPSSAEQIAAAKAEGNNVSVSFGDEKHLIWVSAQLLNRPKPGKAEDAAYVRGVEQYYLKSQLGAKMPQSQASTITLGGRDYPAFGRVFTWPEKSGQLVTFLWVVPHKKRFLTLITQYPDDKKNQGEAMLRAAEAQKSVGDLICETR